jgi:hypothetical protein
VTTYEIQNGHVTWSSNGEALTEFDLQSDLAVYRFAMGFGPPSKIHNIVVEDLACQSDQYSYECIGQAVDTALGTLVDDIELHKKNCLVTADTLKGPIEDVVTTHRGVVESGLTNLLGDAAVFVNDALDDAVDHHVNTALEQAIGEIDVERALVEGRIEEKRAQVEEAIRQLYEWQAYGHQGLFAQTEDPSDDHHEGYGYNDHEA